MELQAITRNVWFLWFHADFGTFKTKLRNILGQNLVVKTTVVDLRLHTVT